jgi:hypothetical protein
MPSNSKMSAWCDKNYARNLNILSTGRSQKVGTDPGGLERWLTEAASKGMNEMFRWEIGKRGAFGETRGSYIS